MAALLETAIVDTLTVAEAAVAAGVSVPEVNRMVDEHILPERLYSTDSMRVLRPEACLLTAFYFFTAGSLTVDARVRIIRNEEGHSPTWDGWAHWSVADDVLTIRFDSLWQAVDGRLRDVAAAKELAVEDPGILSGTPVIRGTRVPVYDVGLQLLRGTSKELLLEEYPSLNERQVELAGVYALAEPLREGPPRRSVFKGWQLISKKVIQLSSNEE